MVKLSLARLASHQLGIFIQFMIEFAMFVCGFTDTVSTIIVRQQPVRGHILKAVILYWIET